GCGWEAGVEDGSGGEMGTGLGNRACGGYAQNKVWLELSLAATDLLTWAQALCFDAALARCEPAAFRYRVLAVAARLIRTGRTWRLRLDKDWPRATRLAAAFAPPPPAPRPARPPPPPSPPPQEPEPPRPPATPPPRPAPPPPPGRQSHHKINNSPVRRRVKNPG